MKKIYMFLTVALVGTSVYAQRSTAVAPAPVVNPNLHVGTPDFKGSHGNRATYWINFAQETDVLLGNTADFGFGLVFPDSNIIAGVYTDGSTAYPQFHKAATMLDAVNCPTTAWSASTPYKLDSVAIGYAYLRALPTNVIDTLVVQIIKHDVSLEWTLSSSGETYQDITYVQSSNTITQSQVLGTYTVLLGDADSSNYATYLQIATPGIPAQTGSNRIGMVVSFKPGYSYTITDSISDKNAFYITSFEQNGTGTAPTYNTGDFNCSYMLPTDVRYDMNANGWNGYFIPTWAWTDPMNLEFHDMWFQFNDVISVQETEMVSVSNAFPNPANANTTVEYTVKQNSDVTITVTDVTGQVVSTSNEGNKAQGTYRADLNTSNFAAGTYFVTINANGATVTNKLTVAH